LHFFHKRLSTPNSALKIPRAPRVVLGCTLTVSLLLLIVVVIVGDVVGGGVVLRRACGGGGKGEKKV
jgi:hypothetical protein